LQSEIPAKIDWNGQRNGAGELAPFLRAKEALLK